VDPLSGIAILSAKYGVKKVAQALFGEGAEADLAEAFIGLLETTEQSHARLLEIERRLDVLISQRYQIASSVGLRYLQQAMLGGRSEERRNDDLARAEHNLIEAAEASASPLQRALCERILLIVRLARHDVPGASDSQIRLDLELGEAVGQLFTLNNAKVEAGNSLELSDDLTLRQFFKRAMSRARNMESIRKDLDVLRNNTDVELAAVAGLFADAATFADILGLPSPTCAPELRTSPADNGTWLKVNVAPDNQVRIAGITCTIERTTRARHDIWAVRVHLSSRRRTAVSASFVVNHPDDAPHGWDTDYVPAIIGKTSEVRPGASVELEVDPESYKWKDAGNWPTHIIVSISGIVLATHASTP